MNSSTRVSFLNTFYQFIEICPECENTEALYAIIHIKCKATKIQFKTKISCKTKNTQDLNVQILQQNCSLLTVTNILQNMTIV